MVAARVAGLAIAMFVRGVLIPRGSTSLLCENPTLLLR
jgi:hypothetical protein